MKTKSVATFAAGLALTVFAAGQAFADTGSDFASEVDGDCGTISFTGQQADTGTGFGTILGLLSLQDKDTDNNLEAGYVVADGTGDEVGGETGQGQGGVINVTRTAQEFIDLGWSPGDAIGIVFNVNQKGAEGSTYVTMDRFVVYAFNADGDLLACWVWQGSDDQYDIGDEQGQGSDGWLFVLNDDAEIDLEEFMATAGNRFGMEVFTDNQIDDANDGADDFYIGVFSGGDTPTPIPLPPAAFLGFAALGGLGIAGRIRSKRRQES